MEENKQENQNEQENQVKKETQTANVEQIGQTNGTYQNNQNVNYNPNMQYNQNMQYNPNYGNYQGQLNYQYTQNNNQQEYQIPEKYRPISAWGYFGYSLLFALPIAGLILLIVFSFDNSNINRRNYARSFFCWIVIAIIIILFIVLGAGIFTASLLR